MTDINDFAIDDAALLKEGATVLIVSRYNNRINTITHATVHRVLKTKFELEYDDGFIETYTTRLTFGNLKPHGSATKVRHNGASIYSTDNNFVEPWTKLQHLHMDAEKKRATLTDYAAAHRFRRVEHRHRLNPADTDHTAQRDIARTLRDYAQDLLDTEEEILAFKLPE